MGKRFPAIYFDGNTAQPWSVEIELSRKSVDIFDDDGRKLSSWPLRHISRVPPMGRKHPIRLKNRLVSNARLTVRDAETVDVLRVLMPKLFPDRQPGMRLARAAVTLGLITAFAVGSLYFSIPRLARPIADAIPPQWESQLGRTTSRTISQNWSTCEGDGLAELDDLVERLMANTPTNYQIRARVIDAEVINAFALPGGNIFITDELIEIMESPDELAGVMAHEIGHIVLRHPLEGMLSQMGVVLFLNMLTAGSTSDILGLGATIAVVSYTRDYETEADSFALEMLQSVNIKTTGYADLFKRLDAVEKVAETEDMFGLESMMRTHPMSEIRAQQAEQVTVEDPVISMSDDGWQKVKALCKTPEAPAVENTANERVDRPSE